MVHPLLFNLIFNAYEKNSLLNRLNLVNLACSFVVDDQTSCHDCCKEHSHYCYYIGCCHHCVTLSLTLMCCLQSFSLSYLFSAVSSLLTRKASKTVTATMASANTITIILTFFKLLSLIFYTFVIALNHGAKVRHFQIPAKYSRQFLV